MTKTLAAILFATSTLLAAPAAQAGNVDIGITIGVPGIIWGGPAYLPPPRHYHHAPRVIVVPRRVVRVPSYRAHPSWDRRAWFAQRGAPHWNARGSHGARGSRGHR